jgi:alpha-N-arabinofuranosidase
MMNRILLSAFMAVLAIPTPAQTKLTLKVDEAQKTVSPTLYGLMTEEINYSYEGGLYAQLLRNPSFKETTVQKQAFHPLPTQPKFWELADTMNSSMSVMYMTPINLTYNNGVDKEKMNTLKVTTKVADASIVNRGFWGIAVRPNDVFNGSLYAKGNSPITVSLESTDGKTIYAKKTLDNVSADWNKIQFSFIIDKKIEATKDVCFRITFKDAGDYSLANVKLFPPTFNNRQNGMRPDLMTMMRDMNPKFLRFPGGNYLEGNKFAEHFDWKRTVGDPDARPGHYSPWGYWSTDGMGLLEFMQWAEDVGAEPLLAVFAGYTLNGDYVVGDALKPYIQDALDEIEYVIGGANTKWGAQRIKDGHPQPFPLHYVEIGNEDFFDVSGSYSERYQHFYDAIKAKYPQLQLISTIGEYDLRGNAVNPEKIRLDITDEHYYRDANEMYRQAFQYDKYSRKGPKIFCGEWATREGTPTTNMNAALGDATWMTCLERNSDLVIASCYAPLFVNVNKGGMQWESDLIGYDALSAYGSPSYYAQVMFSEYLGDKIVPVETSNIPTFKLTDKQGDTAPQIYYSATKDSKSGHIYIKMVNVTGNANDVEITLSGVNKISGKAQRIELKANDSKATNTIANPRNIIPVKSTIKVKNNFSITLAPNSITILKI